MTLSPKFETARRISAVMRILCLAATGIDGLLLIGLLPGAFLHPSGWSYSVGVTTTASGSAGTAARSAIHGVPVAATLIATAVFALWAFWSAAQCFGGFARGELFSRRTLRAFRGFVLATFLMHITPLVGGALLVLAVRGPHVSLPTRISASLSPVIGPGGMPSLIVLTLLLVLLAVLGRAAEIAEDNAAIV